MSNPTAQEQEFLELVNRMRIAPAAELELLLNPADPTVKESINGALKYFKTNLDTLKSQWRKLVAAAPLAWASELNDSATAHNQVMIAANIQSHQVSGEKSLGERVTAAKYNFTDAAENIYAFAGSIVEAEASLALDWGEDNPATSDLEAIDGIQNPTGHRNTLLSSDLREVGISIVEHKNPTTKDVGPLVVTQDFGNRAALAGKAYILGVAFDDKNLDGYYQAGEGVRDVQVKITNVATKASQTLAVGKSGGYQQLVDPGNYQVEFTRGGVTKTTAISVNNPQNVKLDFVGSNIIARNAVSITNNLVLAVTDLGSNLQDNKPEHNLFDFTKNFSLAATPDLISSKIDLKFVEVSADASYHNYAGLYRVDDAAGTVDGLNPGAPGYLTAALKRSKEAGQNVEFDKSGIGAKTLKGGYIYAPFVVADGTVDQVLNSKDPAKAPRVYFNYIAANQDGFNHIKSLGANKFGFEDTWGGGDRDYNDLVFKVDAKVAVIG